MFPPLSQLQFQPNLGWQIVAANNSWQPTPLATTAVHNHASQILGSRKLRLASDSTATRSRVVES
uniref:Uncharacterized protein n=1 Tax=Arundo donax TaxID=35708 RepID=A0A0A9G2T8_ARUDO